MIKNISLCTAQCASIGGQAAAQRMAGEDHIALRATVIVGRFAIKRRCDRVVKLKRGNRLRIFACNWPVTGL